MSDCREVSRFILLGLTFVGWIFAIVSVAHCAFVQVGDTNVGLFKGGYQGGSCVRYDSTDYLGTALKTARAFGVLLTLGVSFALILVFVVVLFYTNRIMWNVYRVLMSLCFIFNLLTFVAFAECADFSFLSICLVGGASVCAILNSLLLLATSILSCCVPPPEEPVFKIVYRGGASSNDNANETIKRTIEEMPDGKKITEEVTDASGNTTVTTTFEPSDSIPTVEGFNVGPAVKITETELSNGKQIVEEDAQGNKTITTKVVVMAGDVTEPDVVVGTAPQPYYEDNAGDVVMAAVVPMAVGDTRRSYQSQDEERGVANPYLSRSKQERRSNQGSTYSDPNEQGSRSSQRRSSRSSRPSSSYSSQDDYPKPNNESLGAHSRSSRGGRPDSPGIDKPPQPRDITSGYLEDSASSAFTDSGNYDDSFMASSSTFDDSFADSSGNAFDSSFAPAATTLDGTGGERKPKKKKKKHRHHSEHRKSSKHRKKDREQSDNVAGGNDVEARGGE